MSASASYKFIILIIIASALCGATVAIFQVPWVDFKALEFYRPGKPSILLDDEGHEWGRFELDRRQPIEYHDVPEHLKTAFIAAEDREFFSHTGISFKGIVRSVCINIVRRRISQGASTITQQLVKLLFTDSRRTFTRKIKEQALSLIVERQFSKEQIFKMYLNHVYFGCGIYGVEAAAQRFWGVPASKLTVAQSATLAGIVRSPGRYCPLINAENCLKRRNLVLRLMHEHCSLSVESYQEALKQPLSVVQQATACAPHLKESIRVLLEQQIGSHRLYQGGLTIQTTINKRMQVQAQQLFTRHFKHLRSAFNEIDGALIILDHSTGQVKTLIGGYDFVASKFNRALQAKRQIGSIFKPLVYAAAIEQGLRFNQVDVDEPISITSGNRVWSPNNYNELFDGPMTYARALATSCNTIAVKVLLNAGMDRVAALGRAVGLPSYYAYPSLALGCIDATLLQSVSAFSVFANNGIRVEPYYVRWVKDEWGNKIYTAVEHKTPVLMPSIAHQVAGAMNIAMQRYARFYKGLRAEEVVAFGKSGTTDDSRTCWFCGSTPEYSVAVYVGRDDNGSLGKSVYPSRVAFPLWAGIYSNVIPPKRSFNFDPNLIEQRIDLVTGELVSADHPQSGVVLLPRV